MGDLKTIKTCMYYGLFTWVCVPPLLGRTNLLPVFQKSFLAVLVCGCPAGLTVRPQTRTQWCDDMPVVGMSRPPQPLLEQDREAGWPVLFLPEWKPLMWPPVSVLHCWSMSLHPAAPRSVLRTRSSLVTEKIIWKKCIKKKKNTFVLLRMQQVNTFSELDLHLLLKISC